MINWVKLLPGKTFRAHYHEDMNELYIILSGTVLITVGKDTAKLTKGDAVYIPQKHVHTMKNVTKKTVQYIALGIATGNKGRTVVV